MTSIIGFHGKLLVPTVCEYIFAKALGGTDWLDCHILKMDCASYMACASLGPRHGGGGAQPQC